MAKSFLIQCRYNFLNNITPSNKENYANENYQRIILYAKKYFANSNYKEFAGFLMEGQYFVSLWAAHMLVEHGKPDKELLEVALKTIEAYAHGIQAPLVAEEEREWLKENVRVYRETS